MTHLDYGMCAV